MIQKISLLEKNESTDALMSLSDREKEVYWKHLQIIGGAAGLSPAFPHRLNLKTGIEGASRTAEMPSGAAVIGQRAPEGQ